MWFVYTILISIELYNYDMQVGGHRCSLPEQQHRQPEQGTSLPASRGEEQEWEASLKHVASLDCAA